jgi:hypothetical protein
MTRKQQDDAERKIRRAQNELEHVQKEARRDTYPLDFKQE